MKTHDATPQSLNASQERMKRMVESLQKYMATYADQYGYLDYEDKTLINDVLYGLGRALSRQYEFANGFDNFKVFLRDFLAAETPRSEIGEPIAWRYIKKDTRAETLSNQPPDRVLFLDDYAITPLYEAPAPAVTGSEGATPKGTPAASPLSATAKPVPLDTVKASCACAWPDECEEAGECLREMKVKP